MLNPPERPAADTLRAQYAELLQRRDELLEAATRLPEGLPGNEIEAGRLADFAKQLAVARKVADETRASLKAPYLEANRVLENFFAGVIDSLDDAGDIVAEKLTAYLLARNVEGMLRGEYGASASLTHRWTFDDLDATTIDLEALRSHFAITDLARAVRSYLKTGARELRGVRIFRKTDVVVR